MADLFIQFRRPKVEKEIINNFIISYEKGKSLYKSKEYMKALEEFKIALNYLNDIWDEYPKIYTLYLIMKTLFHMRNYGGCLSLQEEILGKMKLENKRDKEKSMNKHDAFIKIESKIDVYNLLINFIFDNSGKSVECILAMIHYLSVESDMTLEEKILYFWNYLKGFLQISGVTKTNNFILFKNKYDSMLIEDKSDKVNSQSNSSSIYQCLYSPKLQIDPTIFDLYKTVMNTKLKFRLYEILDKEYFLNNFGFEKDKVINFLHKNMHIYVYEKNKQKLLQFFNTFVALRKIDLKQKFNMTMNELILSQKSRMEDFDIIFSNLIGGFHHIFKKYMKTEKKIYLAKSFIDINKLRPQSSLELNNIKTHIVLKRINYSINKPKEENKKDANITSFDFFNIDNHNIKIPENMEKIEKESVFSDLMKKKKKILKLKNNIFRKRLMDYKWKTPKHEDLTYNKNLPNFNSYLSHRSTEKKNSIDFPNLIKNIKPNNKKIKLNFPESSFTNKNNQIILNEKNNFNKVIEKLEKSKIINSEENKEKKKKVYELRNVNYIFMDILINLYTPINKLENNLFKGYEKINYKKIFPRKIELYKEPQYKSIIKSYHYSWNPSLFLKENQNSFFYYENFLLINNLIFFGICRCYGNKGQLMSNKLSILFPCYLLYIILEDNLKQEKKDINKEIYKLFKTEENSKDFKDMFLLKYFLYKFNTDIKNIPLINDNTSVLKNQINEAFLSSHKDLKNRYKLSADTSGTNLLSCMILHKIIYIFHSGYFEMVIGKFNSNHEWETKTVVKKSDINEEKLKIVLNKKENNNKNGNNKKDNNKKKKEKEKEKVKEKENIVNLNISETEKNNQNDLEENRELQLSKYTIEQNDKFIIIGSKGLLGNLTKDEIINIIGGYYFNKKNADEAASHLIDLVKTKINKNKKENNLCYDYERTDKKQEKEKERFIGYYNDIVCIIIFLE